MMELIIIEGKRESKYNKNCGKTNKNGKNIRK